MKLAINRNGAFYLYSHVVIIWFLLFVTPIYVKAQSGIKIGTTTSNFYYVDGIPVPYKGYDVDLRPYLGYDIELVQLNPQKPLFSYYVNVYRMFSLTNRLGFLPELSFSQKGANFSISDYEEIIYKVKINYIEFPLSFSFQYLQKDRVFSDVYLGGYGAYRINAYKKVAFHNTEADRIKINTVSHFDWGMHLGIDFKYQINNKYFLVDLRLFLGLANVFETPENWTNIYFESHKTKITGINLSLGYEI